MKAKYADDEPLLRGLAGYIKTHSSCFKTSFRCKLRRVFRSIDARKQEERFILIVRKNPNKDVELMAIIEGNKIVIESAEGDVEFELANPNCYKNVTAYICEFFSSKDVDKV
jgi:hypothetical protein